MEPRDLVWMWPAGGCRRLPPLALRSPLSKQEKNKKSRYSQGAATLRPGGLLRGGARVSDMAVEEPGGLRLGRVADLARSGGPGSPSCLAGRYCSILRAEGPCVPKVGGSYSAFLVGV